ncbi:TPA: pyridoxamine 5'-phosphate oxidase family protein [Enterobacter bugandensis]|uniref:2Fe-2S iron-sulfur cluster-binding protein n=1 Tax=Escherichia coli TaxID=562 RepID=UPI0038603D6F|nr:pyridoxamine 5'-phosphate oxidase family protein [Escherichia coli]
MQQTRSVFHDGERAVQARAEVPEEWLKQVEGFVRTEMPLQHRNFFENLQMLILGLLDSDGRPWCVPALGSPGFLVSPTPDTLEIHRAPVLSRELDLDLSPGASVGALGIDLLSRRRNRVNGRIQHAAAGVMTIGVDQSFGNCPQYIQARQLPPGKDEPGAVSRRRGSLTDPEVRRIIEAADTFFIASRAAGSLDGGSAGVDASHRGGRPGFLGINGDGTLSFPDFSGNRFFNTLGNIESDGRVGLFVPDFETGEAVVLTGRGSVDWDPDRIRSFEGAERIVDVVPEEIWHASAVMPVIGPESEPWPGLVATGTWNDARLTALKTGGYRRFRVASKIKESENITSFYLTPADGGSVEMHQAGQFLPVRLRSNGEVFQRSYTISQGPNGQNYRLSVKREEYGVASRLLHDHCEAGDVIEVGSPAGSFVLDDSTQPIVMLSGGVGITPMMAMLDAQILALEKGASRRMVYFVHATKNSASQAFRRELRSMAQRYDWLRLFTAYSAPGPEDKLGDTHDTEVRLSVDALSRLLPFGGYQFYLCGPESFMQSLYAGLREIGVDPSHIHHEFFGAGELGEPGEVFPATVLPESAQITFTSSEVNAEWTSQSGTLLDVAEAAGLRPGYNCRSGKCGSCAARLVSGSVHYPRQPAIAPADGEVLVCCAVPAEGYVEIEL